jgi:hypothetical protein
VWRILLLSGTKILRQLGLLKVQRRSLNGLKVANQYTLLPVNDSIGRIYHRWVKTKKITLPRREECTEESRESTARTEEELLSSNNKDIVIEFALTS